MGRTLCLVVVAVVDVFNVVVVVVVWMHKAGNRKQVRKISVVVGFVLRLVKLLLKKHQKPMRYVAYLLQKQAFFDRVSDKQ